MVVAKASPRAVGDDVGENRRTAVSDEESGYRLRMAAGFLEEARHNLRHDLWRSCVDNAQLATENAAKAILSLLGPVGRTHDPGALLVLALREKQFPEEVEDVVTRVARSARTLGPQIHVESDYGDEAMRRTPWELFDRASAEQALALAEEAVALATGVVEAGSPPADGR
jgi:HEPN domain-containing protein